MSFIFHLNLNLSLIIIYTQEQNAKYLFRLKNKTINIKLLKCCNFKPSILKAFHVFQSHLKLFLGIKFI